MPKRSSKFTESLKQLGEIQVNDWDFMDLLNKDIGDLEITESLRKLGSIQVTEWDFRSVLPAVNKLAHQEVDIVGLVKKTAHYKVMDWDFKSPPPSPDEPAAAQPGEPEANPEEVEALIMRLKDFLEYVTVKLIDEPNHAHIKIQQIGPVVARFRLILVKRDVAMLIGREGHTASAIRNTMKAAARRAGVHVLLDILSHEEEMARVARTGE